MLSCILCESEILSHVSASKGEKNLHVCCERTLFIVTEKMPTKSVTDSVHGFVLFNAIKSPSEF